MKQLNPSDYKNVLPHIKLNSAEISNIIKNQHLKFYDIRNEDVEWKLKLPMFAKSFYKFVYFKNDIPTQEDFFEYYVNDNYNYFKENNFNDEIMVAIKARAFRTLPSLIRDIHFNKYVENKMKKFNVLYSLDLDINDGIDLLLYNNEKMYAINLYTNTRNAKIGRECKKYRHEKFNNVEYIELPVNLDETHKLGNFYLYGETEYNNLIKIIEP